MSSEEFYSWKSQVKWEIRRHWLMTSKGELLAGMLIAASGFYFLRVVGHSLIYDVVAPYIFLGLFMAQFSYFFYQNDFTNISTPFSRNLPVEKTTALDAHVLYSLLITAVFELFILFAVWIRLGGGGLTPHYRLHPDCMVFPFLMALCGISFCKPWAESRVQPLIFIIIGVWILVKPILLFSKEVTPAFTHTREMPVIMQFVVAIIMLLLGIAEYKACRRVPPVIASEV